MKFRLSTTWAKGQTALETTFVLSMLFFMTFAFVNMGVLFHTKNIATYAAFMAGRSYQVLGDQTAAGSFKELGPRSAGTQEFLKDMPTVGALRTAEDILTCGLPWMTVPEGDALTTQNLNQDPSKRTFSSRCLEGQRKYEKLNIGKVLRFLPFKQDAKAIRAGQGADLESIANGFSEKGRQPLRYGILNLKYRTPLLFDFGGLFTSGGSKEDALVREEVFVPVLLNPGLNSGLQAQQNKFGKSDDEDFK